ncbi:MAG: aromatic ring-hydroxylating dioxygenase subunit alpha [Umezawaea sp.]
MTSIPRDQWYVAAYGREIGPALFSGTVCGESILFWRTASGRVTAMADRCVHRRFPLSEPPTRLVDDQVVCGYHGFTYAADGRCVAVPGQTRVPRTARLSTYPVVEQDSFVWVWIGDPLLADDTAIPRAPWLTAPDYTTVSGMEPLAARFELLVDNLLDLSHETYLHGGYIGTPEVASTPITTEVDEAAGVVCVSRRMADADTPETEHTTHDFWAVARDFALDDEEVSTFLAESNRTVVLQDVAALDVLERVIASEPDGYQELSINIDTGGLAARRILARLAGGRVHQVTS